MSLRHSYTLIAPLYDAAVAAASHGIRKRSLARLEHLPASRVLLVGVGTGLDLPLLPPRHEYIGIDLTRAMLARARPRAGATTLVQADAHRLPFPAAAFDAAVLHLILAVVPQPLACLSEAARVVRPGGELLVMDKFLRPGERAPLRRALNPIVSRVATRLDVVFEDLLAQVPSVSLASDEPALAGGWFRILRLVKTG